MWRLADFLDPRRQSIQHHKRLGIDRLRMLPRQPPDRLGGPAEAARRPAAPVAGALAPLQYPLDARAALDYPPLLVQPHHHAIVGVAALAVLPVQLVPHGPSPRSWEAARRARRALPVHLPGWGAICPASSRFGRIGPGVPALNRGRKAKPREMDRLPQLLGPYLRGQLPHGADGALRNAFEPQQIAEIDWLAPDHRRPLLLGKHRSPAAI